MLRIDVTELNSKVAKGIRQAALNASTSVDWASSSSFSLGKSKRRDRSKSPPKKRSRTNVDSDDEVVNIPESDDENADDPRRIVALKSTLDPDTVIKAFRLKKPKLVHFRPHTLPFDLGTVSGIKTTFNFFTLLWVIRSRTRNKPIAKSFSASLSVNSILLYISRAPQPCA